MMILIIDINFFFDHPLMFLMPKSSVVVPFIEKCIPPSLNVYGIVMYFKINVPLCHHSMLFILLSH